MNNIAKTLMFIEKYMKENQEISPELFLDVLEEKLNEDADEFFLFLLENGLVALTEDELIYGNLIFENELDYDEIANIYEERFLSISLTKKQINACEKMSELFVEIKKKKELQMKNIRHIVEDEEDLNFLINVMSRKNLININEQILSIGNQGRMIKKISDPTRIAIEGLIDEGLEKNQNEEDKKDIRNQILETNNMSFYIIRVLNSYSSAISKHLILSKIKNMIGSDIIDEKEVEKKFEIIIKELTKCGFLKIKRSIGFVNNEEVYLSRLSNSFYPSFIDENKCILIPYNQPGLSPTPSKSRGSEIETEQDNYEEYEDEEYEDYNMFIKNKKRRV